MKLEDLGYLDETELQRQELGLGDFGIGRVSSEHKERYEVMTELGEFEAEIIGSLRFSAKSRADFPAVGDWVAVSEYDENKLLIHAVLPRKTIIERQSVGKFGEKQIIATNIDYALVVQAVDRDFNVNRIERYLTISLTSGVKPIIVLNKIDLISDEQKKSIVDEVESRIKNVPIISMSNESGIGIEIIRKAIQSGNTYCLLGSSGVGKSILLNNLAGQELMKTSAIGVATNRGRHVTSHRELIILENGGILIDNPGMREVGIADADSGLELTFEKIMELSSSCKFNDCTQIHETGCAVVLAVEDGEIEQASYENFLKMEREKNYFESTVIEKKKKDKDLGKVIKHFKKERKRGKY